MSVLLDRAKAQLATPSPNATRRACWLARAALEARVRELLEARDIDASKATERGRLSCLEGAYADERHLTARAEYAWQRLSEACHQHAYELSPTWFEASRLVELVDSIETARTRPTP